MHYSSKFTNILLILMFVGGVTLGYFFPHKKEVTLQPATEVYKEVAHIDSQTYSNAQLIYTDYEDDINYYVANDVVRQISSGDIVYMSNGDGFTVMDTSLSGFYINVLYYPVQAGMSGEPIWYNGTIIGYISKLYSNEMLYCIWST